MTSHPTTTVHTRFGALEGPALDGLFFCGIPYAAPPVGPLRWMPPAPPAPWPGVRPALHFGPYLPPRRSTGGFRFIAMEPHNEDCLYLNVWTPDSTTRADPCSFGSTAASSIPVPARFQPTTVRGSPPGATSWSSLSTTASACSASSTSTRSRVGGFRLRATKDCSTRWRRSPGSATT